MPKFSLKRLKSWQHPYPELQAKAHNASCQIKAAASFCVLRPTKSASFWTSGF